MRCTSRAIITESDYESAKAEELVFRYADSSQENGDDSDYYSYFVDQVIRDVVSDLADATGYDTEVINRMILGMAAIRSIPPLMWMCRMLRRRSMRTSIISPKPPAPISSCNPAW